MWNGNFIVIKEGQLITGRKELSDASGIPETTIERILNMLETGHQIEQQKTTKYRLITIINWQEYQKSDSKVDNKRTTNGQQTDTNKNDKKNKNEKKNLAPGGAVVVNEAIELFKLVNPSFDALYRNTTQRSAADRLVAKYGMEKLKQLIQLAAEGLQVRYAPKITTPYQLEMDLAKLLAWHKTRQGKNNVAFV